ncbi:MAG TPA: nitroreductase family protein [Tissierellales bacterium]|nr:nitroreductase family protein [Tissierellales bacterium]
MLMNNFLKNRKSVREYKNKNVDKKLLDEVINYGRTLEKCVGDECFNFPLFTDGKNVYDTFKGKGGYAGVMIESPHYIGLEITKDSPKNIIRAAYGMEKMITKAIELNLGTCWISIQDVDENFKKEIYPGLEGNMDYLLSIGYPVPKNPFIEESSSGRHSVEEVVFNGKVGKPISYEELETRGLSDLFYYLRFAPSSHNSQPWRFILKNDRIILTLKDSDENLNLTDAGIVIYYLEQMLKSIGLSGGWQLIPQEFDEYEGSKYTHIAEFKI